MKPEASFSLYRRKPSRVFWDFVHVFVVYGYQVFSALFFANVFISFRLFFCPTPTTVTTLNDDVQTETNSGARMSGKAGQKKKKKNRAVERKNKNNNRKNKDSARDVMQFKNANDHGGVRLGDDHASWCAYARHANTTYTTGRIRYHGTGNLHNRVRCHRGYRTINFFDGGNATVSQSRPDIFRGKPTTRIVY